MAILAGCTSLDDQTDALKENIKEKAIEELERTVLEGLDSHDSRMADSDPGQTINEYFGEEIGVYIDKPISIDIDCISGDCPDPSEILGRTTAGKCFFCNGSYVKGDTAFLNIGGSGGADGNTACWKTFDNDWTRRHDSFDIIEKTDDKLVVRVLTNGHVEQTGDGTGCENYEYDWERTSDWIFNRNPPAPDVIMESQAKVDSSGNYQIEVAASDEIGPGSSYSNDYVRISCSQIDGIHSSPGLLLTEVNGVELYGWKNREEREEQPGVAYGGIVLTTMEYDDPERTSATYRFASIYGGTYLLAAECSYYYYDQRVSNRGDRGIEVTVHPGTNGDIPEDRYMQYTGE